MVLLDAIEHESEERLNWYLPRHRETVSRWVTFEAKKAAKAEFVRGARENRWIVYRDELDWPEAFKCRAARYRVKSGALDTERRFRTLTDQWKQETRFVSSPNQMFLVPSYQRIIGLGPAAVPLILRELQNEPNHWFWALTALTGENPVQSRDAGNVHAMRQAWTEWGHERGYF